jgi:hypothetical protein
VLLLLPLLAALSGEEYFQITVVDRATGRGVPMVELRTSNAVSRYTDSQGHIAWNEPGLMDRPVYFEVRSHGYWYGAGGLQLTTIRGGKARIEIDRVNIAERLYRVTGQGIYRDSVLLGLPVPLREPVLNAEVMGQDTVLATPYKGRIFWLWDDTSRAAYPLGSLAGSGATSELPGQGGLDPAVGVNLTYFVDKGGFSKAMTPFVVRGTKWKYWLAVVKDRQGQERLTTHYRSMMSLIDVAESGVAVFNDATEVFEPYSRFEPGFGMSVPAHPFRVASGRAEYLYFSQPLPVWRAHPVLEELADAAMYEGYTPLVAGSRYRKAATSLDRDSQGRLTYGWKRGTPPLQVEQEEELVQFGRMKPEERLCQLRDVVTDEAVKPHAGSVAWNAWRRRWVMIVQEDRGLADPGEIWYAEADTPPGPWVYARKVVTHDKYNFYNPVHHPFFDQEGGRLIYFEGTVSTTFSGSQVKIPAYDYNQMMYRLALDDPRLVLPVAVYRLKDGRFLLREGVEAAGAWADVEGIPFFALEPGRRDGTVPVAGLFDALPVEIPPDDWLDGRWACRESNGSTFEMSLQREGEAVRGYADGRTVQHGRAQGRRLEFDVDFDGTPLRVDGTINGARLEGAYHGGGEVGPFECQADVKTTWLRAPALVPLYVQRTPGGRVEYTTEAAPGATLVGRVWRNPVRADVLDRNAKAR